MSNNIIYIAIAIALVSGLISFVLNRQSTKPDGDIVACPADVMLCEDGTYVGRSGENCEFVCPTPLTSDISTTTPTTKPTPTPAKTSYTITDIKSVTLIKTGTNALDGGVYTYTITLDSDKKFKVTTYDMETSSGITERFRATGYTGDVAQLIAMASSSTNPNPIETSYTITDVKSITQQSVDPIPTAIDDEYTLYIITLKSGVKFTVQKSGMERSPTLAERFQATGYTGDVDLLLAMATDL